MGGRPEPVGMGVGEYRDCRARGDVADLDTVRHAVGAPIIVREHTVQDNPQDRVDEWIAIRTAVSARINGQGGGTKLAATGRQALATGAQEGVSE